MTQHTLKQTLDSTLQAAELHAQRLTYAKEQIKPRLPVSGAMLKGLSDKDIPIFELFTSRFAKLQDTLGGKLFKLALDFAEEPSPHTTFLDTLNTLEKLGCISDRTMWLSLRETRNHLSHEYPDNYDDLAHHLNKAVELSDFLIDTLHRVKAFIIQTAEKRSR